MALSEEAKQARREYKKKWNEKNHDKMREYQREYHKEWRKRNPDKIRKYNETYWERKSQMMIKDHE